MRYNTGCFHSSIHILFGVEDDNLIVNDHIARIRQALNEVVLQVENTKEDTTS
jgi:hypothetical protein